MEEVFDKCLYCKRGDLGILAKDTNYKICDYCCIKIVLFNKNNFYANCDQEIELNCILFPNRKIRTTRYMIWKVLGELENSENINISNKTKCEFHQNLIESVYCKDCNIYMCLMCFDHHKKTGIFSKHEKGIKKEELNEKCPHHYPKKYLQYQCLDCDVPICVVCKAEDHKLHDLEYLEEFYELKKNELIQNMKLPFKNLEKLLDRIKTEEDEVIESINKEFTFIADGIQNLINTLKSIQEDFNNRRKYSIENVKINSEIMRMKYKYLYNQMHNLNSEDYFNLNLLSKMPKEHKIKKMEIKVEKNLFFLFDEVKQLFKKINTGNEEIFKINFTDDIEIFEKIRELKVLEGHFNCDNTLNKLNDGKLASCSDDNTIKIWDTQTGKCIMTLVGHSDTVNGLLLLNNGKLASFSDDNTIKIWQVKTGTCLSTLKGHSKSVFGLIHLNDGSFGSCSDDNTIKIWDINTGTCVRTLEGHLNSVFNLTLLNDGKLASGSWYGTIKLWCIQTGICIRTLNGHNGCVYSLLLHKDDRLVSGSADKSIKIWDSLSGNCIMTLEGHYSTITSLALLNDNKLASGSEDSMIKIWDILSGVLIMTFSGHSNLITSMIVLNDRILISSSNDKTIKIWEVESGICIKTLDGHSGRAFSLIMLDNRKFAFGSNDKKIKIWGLLE